MLLETCLSFTMKGISAHSTRVGLNQDLFVVGEDLAGIMNALRWIPSSAVTARSQRSPPEGSDYAI